MDRIMYNLKHMLLRWPRVCTYLWCDNRFRNCRSRLDYVAMGIHLHPDMQLACILISGDETMTELAHRRDIMIKRNKLIYEYDAEDKP